MTSNRLKSLARFRLILSVTAVLLAGLMVFSGFMYFGAEIPAPPEEVPTETVGEPIETLPPPSSEITEATEPESSEVTTEPEASTSENEENLKPEPGSSHGWLPIGPFGDPDPTEVPDATVPATTVPDNSGTTAPSWGNSNAHDHSHNDTPSATPTTAAPSEVPTENTEKTEQKDQYTEVSVTPPASTPVTELPAENNNQSEQNVPDTPPAAEFPENPPSEEVVTEQTHQPEGIPSEPAEAPKETENLKGNLNISTKAEEDPNSLWMILFWTSGGLLIVDLAAIVILSGQIRQEKKRLQRIRNSLSQTDEQARRPAPGRAGNAGVMSVQSTEFIQPLEQGIQISTLHQVGRRDYQQDSLGHISVLDAKGILAVVADGMGGLSGGEKVSQKIVMDALEMGRQLKPEQLNGVLWKMVEKINSNVNQMLGPEGLYKSGSTLLAVLAHNGKFQWIAVGDSRIYLYRQGYANQLNQDHDQLQVWMADVLSGRRTMEEVLRNPESRKLTSFIGMGQLKYIDGSRGAIALEPGDRLVLMSDGVYNVVNETALAGVLKRYPDVDQAASVIDRMIREHNHPHQDNYTAIVLGF